MNTVTCPTCKAEHGVYWLVAKSGRKTLSFMCDRQPTESTNKAGLFTKELRYVNKELPVPDRCHEGRPGLGVGAPERWSKGWAKAKEAERQKELL